MLTVPGWKVVTGWLTTAFFGRDIVSPASVEHPTAAFVPGDTPPAVTTRRAARS